MASSELAEIETIIPSLWSDEELSPQELLEYTLFWGQDALLEGIDAYFEADEIEAYRHLAQIMASKLKSPCYIRFDIKEVNPGAYCVSPEFWIGLTPEGYLAGLLEL